MQIFTNICPFQPYLMNVLQSELAQLREDQPLGYTDVYAHLEGKDPNGRDVIGAYAIIPDNTCFFAATSMANGYQDDVKLTIEDKTNPDQSIEATFLGELRS